jgi:hypothetical protein
MSAVHWRAISPRDKVTIDGQAVVMVGDRVTLLSEMATFALAQLGEVDWTSDVDLTATLVARYGAPEHVRDAVFSLVSALLAEGLVEVRPD